MAAVLLPEALRSQLPPTDLTGAIPRPFWFHCIFSLSLFAWFGSVLSLLRLTFGGNLRQIKPKSN